MSENTVITEAPQAIEITELTREGKLPDSRFIPMVCGRATREMLTYNRHEIHPLSIMSRLRERDCFVFGSEKVMLSVSILDYGYCGAVCVTLLDCTEAKERSQTKLVPFSMGTVGLPISVSTGDLMFRSEDASIDFLRSPDRWYIRIYFDRFDDVRSLYVNVAVEDPGGESSFSTMPIGRKNNRFFLRHGLYAMPASGQIVLGADVYELDRESSMGWLERERSDGGRIPEHHRISISGLCGELRFGLCASESGMFTAENALIVNGRVFRPEGLNVQRGEKVWYVSTPDGHVQLYLPVVAERTDRVKFLSLNAERRREYGLCFGELTIGGQRRLVTTALGCGERVTGKC